MTIAEALSLAAEKAGWSSTKLAAVCDVSESAARKWLAGDSEMRASAYQTLRRDLPGFADLVDGSAQVA